MNISILKLIKTVNDNYTHIQELMTLSEMIEEAKISPYWTMGLEQEYIVCMTTINSHYGYELNTTSIYQNPDNHIDRVLSNGLVNSILDTEPVQEYNDSDVSNE